MTWIIAAVDATHNWSRGWIAGAQLAVSAASVGPGFSFAESDTFRSGW